ncbi:MAG TPA: hypothetical protein VFY03_14350 [Woeseiaceae bacterium]|nr:hypothetical protein [Woeseiaceae bacterium]
MYIDRERHEALVRERAAAEARIGELVGAGNAADPAPEAAALQARIRDIDAELQRMEFATELERQSDA